jgi:hypothetical protein
MKPWSILIILFAVLFGSYLLMVSSKNWSEILPTEPVNPNPELALQLQTWIEISPPAAGFKALFPVAPQNAKETVMGREYDMYVAEHTDGTLYMVSSITFPHDSEVIQKGVVLKTLMHEMVESNPQNSLEGVQEGNENGKSTLQFKINGPSRIIEAKEFLVGDKVYILSRLSNQQHANSKEFDTFVKSFQLMEK